MTGDGRMAYESTDTLNDVLRTIATYNIDLIRHLPSVLDSNLLEQGTTGLLTALNAQLKANKGHESIAQLRARLHKEAEVYGASSPQGPKKIMMTMRIQKKI